MPTLQIQSDGYGLIRAAHRLSDAAAAAVKAASHDPVHGLWKIDCSPDVAQELWTWFDDCEQHSVLLDRELWGIYVCQRAKQRIQRRNSSCTADQTPPTCTRVTASV